MELIKQTKFSFSSELFDPCTQIVKFIIIIIIIIMVEV